MTEVTVRGTLLAFLRKELKKFVIIRHEDRFTKGIPDLSVTGEGKTSWWEIKLLNPRLISSSVQELTMIKLAEAGIAFYVLFDVKLRETRIVEPRHLRYPEFAALVAPGFNSHAVSRFIYDVHRRHSPREER